MALFPLEASERGPWRSRPSGVGRPGGPGRGALIHLDGAEQSGSGTLIRFAVALAALVGEPLHVVRARARRPKPGLRPQHVAAVQACAALCEGRAEGLAVGASEFRFWPGRRRPGGAYAWDIGTAGSATMLALGVLPVSCLAERPIRARIVGGIFQDFAPSPHALDQVLAPFLARMGAHLELRLVRPGYVPGGAGELALAVEPARALRALVLDAPGRVGEVRGVALASHLAQRRVAERMGASCEAQLARAGLPAHIERLEDTSATQPGAGLSVWAETTTGCRLGADRAGARGRSAESIGRFVARQLAEDLGSGASVDRHVADQLVPFAAVARGTSRFAVPRDTEHLRANLWLAERFGAKTRLDGLRIEIEGLGISAGGSERPGGR